MEELHKQNGHNKTTCQQIQEHGRLRMDYTNITHGYKDVTNSSRTVMSAVRK
jgi:hypothetical protein